MKMDGDKSAHWTRRDVLQAGGMASAMGVMGGVGMVAPSPVSEAGNEIYTRVGVRPFINLTGTLTINGGCLSLSSVREAEHQAADYSVNLDELMEKVGARIAELLGCEGAIVTSGAAAALAHATVASIAGSDPELIQQIPDLTGLKDEVLVFKQSRNVYDHALRSTGVRMVEVATPEAFQAALGPRTALVYVLGTGEAQAPLRLEGIAAAAHAANVPVIVDAAAELPRRPDPYLTRGADLVVYSGGKVIRGPQCAGLLLGRKDLVWAAFINSAPHHAWGRMMKVGKEETMGMLAAVESLMGNGIDADYARWRSYLDEIASAVVKVPGVRTKIQEPAGASPYPTMEVAWDPAQVGITAGELYQQLLDGEPRIMSQASGEGFSFNIRPPAIRDGDQTLVARRLAEVLRKAPRGVPKVTLAAPVADLAGRWVVDVEYSKGTAEHRLFLETDGNKVVGTHVGRRLQGALSGTVDGDRVQLRSRLPYQGTQLNFTFSGRISGPAMEGEVDLDEYGQARWKARRLAAGKT